MTTPQAKIEELALMLVMTTEGDVTGYGLLQGLLDELIEIAMPIPEFAPLVAAAKSVGTPASPEGYLSRVETFAAEAQRFMDDPAVTFSAGAEGTSSESPWGDDVSPDLDPNFLAEFIETHSLLLQDFEANILDFQNGGTSAEDIETSAKRYIHNLKGDAGSIGLRGIERACHDVETAISESSVAELVAPLLSFKEWVAASLVAFTEGHAPEVSADSFLASFLGTPDEGAAVTPTENRQDKASDTGHEQAAAPTAKETATYKLQGEREILTEFAAEVEEHLTSVESVLLDAQGSYPRDAIDTIFRAVHSVKGGSAYFGLEEMTRCSHILENFLSEVRDGKRELDAALANLLFVYVDLQKNVLARARKALSADGTMQFAPASAEFLGALEAYGKGEKPAPVAPEHQSSATRPAVFPSSSSPSPAADDADHRDAAAGDGRGGEKVAVKNFVKVDTTRLDQLIDSIGEMVIYSSMLIRHCRELLGEHERVMDTTHRVEKFSRDLQDIGMSMRLVPIKGLFQKMSRLVWDTSKKLGKDVVFTMEGEDTELDRNLIDKLADPLMHMVRNSLDHGVEPPEERIKKGKPAAGNVTLSAYHAGGSIHIQIKDDGKGLDPEKLIAKAVEKGLIPEGQKLSDTDAFQLIFASGFSTAAAVTDISGRGVGMDVVRRNVESLRGRINIQSKVGEGSTFTIELPLTLAIIDGVQICVGSEAFIVPSLSIIEFVKAKPQMLSTPMDRGETFHFRGSYIPLYRIADLYGIEPRSHDVFDGTIVVVQNDRELVALLVDDILGECSTVIKSLGPIFGESKGIAGCSIMPQGNVALILDVRSLVELARVAYLHRRTPIDPSSSQRESAIVIQ